MGVKIGHNVDPRDFFAPGWGDIVCEVPDGKVGELSISYTLIGEVTTGRPLNTAAYPFPLQRHWIHGTLRWRTYSPQSPA